MKIGKWNVRVETGNDGYYVGDVPKLPGCHTQARTIAELKRRMKEVIALCLDVRTV